MLNKYISITLFALPLFISTGIQASDPQAGQDYYQQHCMMCHGNSGTPMMAGAPDFNRGQGLLQSDYSLLDRIKAGKNACPSFIGILKDQQIFDVIAHIRTFY